MYVIMLSNFGFMMEILAVKIKDRVRNRFRVRSKNLVTKVYILYVCE